MVKFWHRKRCHVTGPLWRESIGHRWIPLTKGKWRGTFVLSEFYDRTSCWTKCLVSGNLRGFMLMWHHSHDCGTYPNCRGNYYNCIMMKARACVHNIDVMMSAIASQITSVSIVYSTVCSGVDKKEHQRSASLAAVRGISPVTGEFPAQRASNAENVSIWWRHHV